MVGRKKKAAEPKEEAVPVETVQPEPAPYAPPSQAGIDYKEKLAYGNLMSELIGLVSFAINRGGNGRTELETVWMNLLPEIKEELNDVYTDNFTALNSELAGVPDGLIYFNENSQRWEDVGNDNNRVLNVRELLNPKNRGISQEMIFNGTINKRKIIQSGLLKDTITRECVKEIIPEIIKALQNHDLLMQTRRKTDVGAFSMVRSDGNERILEKDMDEEDGI